MTDGLPQFVVGFRELLPGRKRPWWLPRWLMRFYHCQVWVFAAEAGGWIGIDPYEGGTNIKFVRFMGMEDPLTALPIAGWTAVAAELDGSERGLRAYWLASLLLSPCVADVKRTLFLRRWNVITPDQLYRFLKRKERADG